MRLHASSRAALLGLLGLCWLATPATARAAPADAPLLVQAPAPPPAPEFHTPGGSPERAAFLRELNTERIHMNWVALGVLTGWSALNIALGGLGWALADDPTWRAFHQMNLLYNLPLLATEVVGAVVLSKQDPEKLDLYETLRRGGILGRALALGIGLNVAAIFTGAWQWERGLRTDSPKHVGWGRSYILQGIFLLGYDITVFLLNTHYDARVLLMVPRDKSDAAGLALTARF